MCGSPWCCVSVDLWGKVDSMGLPWRHRCLILRGSLWYCLYIRVPPPDSTSPGLADPDYPGHRSCPADERHRTRHPRSPIGASGYQGGGTGTFSFRSLQIEVRCWSSYNMLSRPHPDLVSIPFSSKYGTHLGRKESSKLRALRKASYTAVVQRCQVRDLRTLGVSHVEPVEVITGFADWV